MDSKWLYWLNYARLQVYFVLFPRMIESAKAAKSGLGEIIPTRGLCYFELLFVTAYYRVWRAELSACARALSREKFRSGSESTAL
jgi:hypothetical protein